MILDSFSLEGKVAVVTGCDTGLGQGMALGLAEAGCDIVGINIVEPTETIERVTALGRRFLSLTADLRQIDGIPALLERAVAEFGHIDILVNNAGIQHVSPVETFPVDKWNAIIAINLSSVFHTTRLALPGMRARNWGRIINIASVHGLVASKEKSAYVAAKHGVVGFTKTIALETAQTGVTCNALCPGWVLTPLVQQQIDKRIAEGAEPEAARDALLAEKQPSREFVTPEQLGELALFLCSNGAAQVRGVAWNMDGGWVAQ